MGNRDVCFAVPQKTMFVTVAYDVTEQQWHGGFTVQETSAEGEITHLGAATVEFGPFDSYIEVGHWLASLTRPLRAMQVKKVPLLPD